MKAIGVDCATQIYAFNRRLEVSPQRVEWMPLSHYAATLNELKKHLGESAADDYWQTATRPFKSYLFALCATPLPPKHPLIFSEERWATVEQHLRNCDALYPGCARFVNSLLERYRELAGSDCSPILQVLVDRFSEAQGNNAVLIKETRYLASVESIIETSVSENLSVVTPAQLRGNDLFDEILMIGPSRWFPDYVFYSPRAPKIQVTTFTFVSDSWRRSNVFAGSSLTPKRPAASAQKVVNYNAPASGTLQIEADELLPEINWSEISRTGLRSNQIHLSDVRYSNDEETVARLFMLEGERAVFLEAFESSRALVIDLEHGDIGEDNPDSSFVKKVNTRSIEPGIFVLLRTYGSGDYILPVADKILGSKAGYARALQGEWKNRLHEKVRELGPIVTCSRLREHGAIRAIEINLRNWLSSRLIRPQADEDFTAILMLTDLGQEKTQYFDAAARIHSAHQSAGHRIRQQLVGEINKSDLSALQRLGEMEFELPEAGGGSLTAFRVISASPDQYNVFSSRVGVPFEINRTAENTPD